MLCNIVGWLNRLFLTVESAKEALMSAKLLRDVVIEIGLQKCYCI